MPEMNLPEVSNIVGTFSVDFFLCGVIDLNGGREDVVRRH